MMRQIVLVLLLVLLAICPAHAREVEIQADLHYGPDAAEVLDVCLPPEPGPTRPGVVLIHGGGWSSGSREDPIGLCKDFADHGLVVANIDYRLAGTPGGTWPAQIQDAQLAVRWLRTHAVELNIDPARICALGDSAGAHLAVFLAVLRQTVPGDRSNELATASSSVTCAVDNFGPVDLTVPSPFRGALHRLAGTDDVRQVEEIGREASPLFMVSAATSPMMIVQGDDDLNVPPAQSEALADALRKVHVPLIYVTFSGGHEFKNAQAEKRPIFQFEATFIASIPARSR